MTDEQFTQLMQSMLVLNTGIQQLIDINMVMMPDEQREIVDLVHNHYNKFLSDDSWVQDYYNDHGHYPEL